MDGLPLIHGPPGKGERENERTGRDEEKEEQQEAGSRGAQVGRGQVGAVTPLDEGRGRRSRCRSSLTRCDFCFVCPALRGQAEAYCRERKRSTRRRRKEKPRCRGRKILMMMMMMCPVLTGLLQSSGKLDARGGTEGMREGAARAGTAVKRIGKKGEEGQGGLRMRKSACRERDGSKCSAAKPTHTRLARSWEKRGEKDGKEDDAGHE